MLPTRVPPPGPEPAGVPPTAARATCATLVVDRSGVVLSCGDAALGLIGAHRGELEGCRLSTLIAGAGGAPGLPARRLLALADGSGATRCVLIVRGGGHVHIEVAVSRVNPAVEDLFVLKLQRLGVA